MRLPKFLVAMVVSLILLTAKVNAEPITEGIDWTRSVITVTGEGISPMNAVNQMQARGLAAKAARADAYNKLAEIINGVRVESETTVENLLTVKSTIRTRVEATIKGAKVISETFPEQGGCRVVMQVPLFGANNSLANAVLEKNTTIEPFPNPMLEVEPSEIPYNSSTPVKRRIEIAENKVIVEDEPIVPTTPAAPPLTPVTPYKPPLSRMSLPTTVKGVSAPGLIRKRSVAEYAKQAKGDFTGLIVDCRGMDLHPIMSPVIVNSNGTTIYGHKNIDIDKIISMGVVAYIDDTNNVERAGDNPIVVRAIGLEYANSSPVLSIADSNRVLIENYATKFLRDLKVIFLID